ncbi:unnamed protein product [Orchesella dallaii]|uniref:Uncharacterized protein n=1 Tax=Orchesella dallaii TaxID=48710 RepID=A0ABP1PWV9_9HEXA
MGSTKKRSPVELVTHSVSSSSFSALNSSSDLARVTKKELYTHCRGQLHGRKCYAKCTTSKSHNTSNFFSLGNGLILILLFLDWTSLVHGGYPGRGPPRPPRGPPLLPRHPHPRGGGGPPRSSIFNRKHSGPPGPAQRRGPPNAQSDLAVAAQTLYDLRGYHHLPISGPQDNPRFHRQNDPFTLPTPLASNQRPRGVHQDSRTAPLVFPSFYQEQPTPTPTRSTIFGHNQHLSQTRFEPPAGFHLGGNSAAGKITFEQQSSPSGARDHQFRPSQIDISLHGNTVQATPSPSPTPLISQQHQQQINHSPEKQNIPNTRTSGSHDSRTRVSAKLSKEQQQDPFVYVYDDVDYEEGEEDFSIGRQRAPQNQINNNRITPSTTTTTAPLRSREPTIVPSSTPFSPLHQQQYHHTPQLYSTTTTKQPSTTQNSLFYSQQKDEYHNARDVFRDHGIIRPPVTPRPNVEINPSSERKPPPDQSNAIAPALTRHNSGLRDYNNRAPQQVPVISDEPRFRRPTQSTTTTTTEQPPPPQQIAPQYQRENIFHHQQQQQHPPQARQVPPSAPQSQVPYFPAGLDRRPFETNNERQVESQRQRNHFDQVVNLLQEEEEEFPQNNAVVPSGPSNFEHSYNNPSRLRPVNTLIPKNRIPKEDIILPPNFPYLNSELTTTLTPIREEVTRVRGDPTQQRVRDNKVTRIREEIPRHREEIPRNNREEIPRNNREEIPRNNREEIPRNNREEIPRNNREEITRHREEIPRNRDEIPRNREEIPRVRDEVPRVPQRVIPTQPQVRTRPPLVIHEDINENIINNQHSAPSPSPPSRTRGQSPSREQPSRLASRTTTTPAPAPVDVPPRARTASPRQRLRPNYRLTTTTSTTSTTTTTPVPTYAEYPSQEYLDEYENPQQLYQQSPAPPQVLSPVVPQSQKPISRFPPFPKKNVVSEEFTTTPAPPPQRQRPTPQSQENSRQGGGRQRPTKANRFRETTTLDSTTSPRTTGKPLYTTGKMLSKEGGLYAGQRITSSHVYGQPVPNMPINSVLDRVPSVLDGKVILATTKPSFASPQKHLRSKQRNPDHGPPSRINHSQQRLRPAPTARPSQENSLDIVETVTLRPYQDDKGRPSEETKRHRPGSQFVRGQQASIEKERDGQSVLPRRRKVRPGQRRQQSTSSAPEPFTETVSIHPTRGHRDSAQAAAVEEESTAFQTDRAQILRETVTPISVGSQNTYETTTHSVSSNTPRSRRPRPRPGKQNYSEAPNVSERSRERELVETTSDEPPKPQKPVRKLRPRLRPVPQLSPQQQRGQPSEVVTQSSAQIDRKPTEGPGRFSSRFREESFGTTTISAPTQSLRGEDDEREPSRFSPPTSRPTFKPPPPKKVQARRKSQQAATENDGDALPDSIKLSPKDVIANRKPARRIPPGSASDRLKALQQRRKKVFQQASDQEQAAEGRQVPVRQGFNKRPRKPLPHQIAQEQANEEETEVPPPQAQRLRRPQPSEENSGSKREVSHRPIQQQSVKPNDEDYSNEEVGNNQDAEPNLDNSEYDNEDSPPSPRPQPRLVPNRPPRHGQGFYRNKSVEVTSDEARSVLGIPRPAAPYRPPHKKYQRQNFEEEEDEQEAQQIPRFEKNVRNEGEDDQSPTPFNTVVKPFQQQKVHRERPRPVQQQEQEEPEQEEEEQANNSEYDEDEQEDKEPQLPPRKKLQQNHFVSTTSAAPQQILRKQLNTIQSELREAPENEDEEEKQSEEEEEERRQAFPERATTATVTTSSTTSSSTSSSISPSPTTPSVPVELAPVRSGPLPIKQGAMKLRARLRPNKMGGGGGNGGQPRVRGQLGQLGQVSVSQSSTTESSTSKERKQQGLKHGVIHVSKSLRPRLHSSSGKRSSKKFVAMATENPSLPLESIFSEGS